MTPFFDESGEPCEAVGFDYPVDETEPATSDTGAEAALGVMRCGLLVVISDGHKDGALSRAVALCVLSGQFAGPSEAAKTTGLHPATVCRAVQRMRAQLKKSLRNRPAPGGPRRDKGTHFAE